MFKRLFGRKPGGNATGGDVSVELARIGGAPELEFLLIYPSPDDVRRGLDGWRWIGLAGLTVIAVSAFGEPFFQTGDGAIVQLDTLDGSKRVVADNLPAFAAALLEPEGRDELLLGGLVAAARSAGIVPAPGECYDFTHPPALGGAMDVAHMTTLSLVVKLDLAGQLHEQVKDLPPGTPVDRITIAD